MGGKFQETFSMESSLSRQSLMQRVEESGRKEFHFCAFIDGSEGGGGEAREISSNLNGEKRMHSSIFRHLLCHKLYPPSTSHSFGVPKL